MPEWFADVELVEEMLAKPVSQANIVEALHRANTAPGLNSEPFNGCGGTKALGVLPSDVFVINHLAAGENGTCQVGGAPRLLDRNVR